MKKEIINNNVYYTVEWSPWYYYDRHFVMGIPSMAGIICLIEKVPEKLPECLIFYSCWRNGLRIGLRNLMDPTMTKFPDIARKNPDTIIFKFAIVDSGLLDMQDIMYWLIKEYNPIYNNNDVFEDSKRFKEIYINQITKESNPGGSLRVAEI